MIHCRKYLKKNCVSSLKRVHSASCSILSTPSPPPNNSILRLMWCQLLMSWWRCGSWDDGAHVRWRHRLQWSHMRTVVHYHQNHRHRRHCRHRRCESFHSAVSRPKAGLSLRTKQHNTDKFPVALSLWSLWECQVALHPDGIHSPRCRWDRSENHWTNVDVNGNSRGAVLYCSWGQNARSGCIPFVLYCTGRRQSD